MESTACPWVSFDVVFASTLPRGTRDGQGEARTGVTGHLSHPPNSRLNVVLVRASSILTAALPVCSQRCGSSGVLPKWLRSCLGRPCNSTLAESPQRVEFKVAVMAFRVLHGLAPPYLKAHSPRPRLYIAAAVRGVIRTWIRSHRRHTR